MVDSKSKNEDGKTDKTPSGGINNKAFDSSNPNIYTIQTKPGDELPAVDSTKNLLNQYKSTQINLSLPNTAFIEPRAQKLTSKVSDSNQKCINRPKLVIPLVLMTIVLSIAIITGLVYFVLSSRSSATNIPQSPSNSQSTATPSISTTTTSSTSATATSSETTTPESTLKNINKDCGIPSVDPNLQLTRIIRGYAAVRDSWPWTVSIGYSGPRTSLPHACGGALVNKRFIVTATHCVQSSSIFSLVGDPIASHTLFGSLEKMMRVYVGVNTRSTDITAENTYRVEAVLEHPNFDQNTFKNDLAIIKLDRDVTTSDALNFICVPSETITDPGTDLYAVGWGFTENNFYRASDTLNQVKIQVQTTSTCGLAYLPVLQFCAGNPSLGKDTCNGDSGGPIMQQDKLKRWQLVGVVSNGDLMCTGRENSFCEDGVVHLKCDQTRRIFLTNIIVVTNTSLCDKDLTTFGLKDCSINSKSLSDLIKPQCNGFKECNINFESIFKKNFCIRDARLIRAEYTCEIPNSNIDPCQGNPCGYGALCKNINGTAECYCPLNSNGNPNLRCCKPIKCGCWGDPHCSTFDNLRFDFMGKCKYDLVTTDCYNTNLPFGLVNFSVRHKQETRTSLTNSDRVTYIRYIDIKLYGFEFRLYNSSNGQPEFTLNGKKVASNYIDEYNGIRIYYSLGFLIFTTEFGLTIKWNGIHKAEITLCDYYSKYVCGLCGNADGNSNNDLVDRKNELVDKESDYFLNRTFNWANQWRVLDDSIDGNFLEECNLDIEPQLPEKITCDYKATYESKCSLMKDKNGPWKNCITNLPSDLLDTLYNSCVLDMCALENNSKQIDYMCYAFEELTTKCYELVNSSQIFWRTNTRCPKTCGNNQEFKYMSVAKCPKTCFYTNGSFDCGLTEPIEGCLCKSGFILDSLGNCVLPNKCGCKLPDYSGIIEVGTTLKSSDCLLQYQCTVPITNASIFNRFHPCGKNAKCIGSEDNSPICACTKGYYGDGFNCLPEFGDYYIDDLLEPMETVLSQKFCDDNIMRLECSADTVISILDAEYGRSNLLKCQSMNMSEYLCNPIDAASIIEILCNNKRRCFMEVNSKSLGDPCPYITKYLQVNYKCVPRPFDLDPCVENPCGYGAVCTNSNGVSLCSCPAGASGDAKVRCCKSTTCGCWGDPHCTTFDKAKFDFMGRCKYDLVSTDCFNKTLPDDLVPFSISQKQENRNGRMNVAYVSHIDINVYNRQYRLLKKEKGKHKYTIDGLLSPNNYHDKLTGVKVFLSGGNLVFSTQFGLTVTWNGDHKVDVTLCDTYANYVCGLCGNADGIMTNDFVDKSNKLTDTNNIFYNSSIFEWASSWRISDETTYLDGKICDPLQEPGPNPEKPQCKKEVIYSSNQWCGILTEKTGLWSDCLTKINSNIISAIYDGCLFDMCATENDTSLQADYKCKTYEEMADICNELNSVNTNWRSVTGCQKTCGSNEIYAIRKECPRTCLDPYALTDCGELKTIEGCFCKEGFVLNTNGICVKIEECGCVLPDGSGYLSVGESLKTNECNKKYSCLFPGSDINIEILPSCSKDAICIGSASGQAECVCKTGYFGNGYECNLINLTQQSRTTASTIITNISTTETSSTTANSFSYDFRNEYCYGFGDPYYRTFDGKKFSINETCPYVLAMDGCGGRTKSNYVIIVDHEHRLFNNKTNYMKSIKIFYNKIEYLISKIFLINGNAYNLPYRSLEEGVNVYKKGNYIAFYTKYFRIYFDGDLLLKFQECGQVVCGFDQETLNLTTTTNLNTIFKQLTELQLAVISLKESQLNPNCSNSKLVLATNNENVVGTKSNYSVFSLITGKNKYPIEIINDSERRLLEFIDYETFERIRRSNNVIILSLNESRNDILNSKNFPGPVLCILESENCLKSLLRVSKTLKTTKKYKDIFINPHHTIIQRGIEHFKRIGMKSESDEYYSRPNTSSSNSTDSNSVPSKQVVQPLVSKTPGTSMSKTVELNSVPNESSSNSTDKKQKSIKSFNSFKTSSDILGSSSNPIVIDNKLKQKVSLTLNQKITSERRFSIDQHKKLQVNNSSRIRKFSVNSNVTFSDHPLIEGFDCALFKRDIDSLLPEQCLNDSIIHFYLNLSASSCGKKCYVTSSYLFSSYTQSNKASQWLKNVKDEIFDFFYHSCISDKQKLLVSGFY
ncbi:unnamed protein product [Brachionus calyciflorus]|uniref:Uncharacterized protein n=1 Tax=Brachionus calyciflorus TaxID=104777 RepID=A0A813RRN6_9BILA|nr:unnamed protein product [Brachionus calyciflorus]